MPSAERNPGKTNKKPGLGRPLTRASKYDPSHILVDDVQRSDASATGVSVEEPVQPLPLDPIPDTE